MPWTPNPEKSSSDPLVPGDIFRVNERRTIVEIIGRHPLQTESVVCDAPICLQVRPTRRTIFVGFPCKLRAVESLGIFFACRQIKDHSRFSSLLTGIDNCGTLCRLGGVRPYHHPVCQHSPLQNCVFISHVSQISFLDSPAQCLGPRQFWGGYRLDHPLVRRLCRKYRAA